MSRDAEIQNRALRGSEAGANRCEPSNPAGDEVMPAALHAIGRDSRPRSFQCPQAKDRRKACLAEIRGAGLCAHCGTP